MDAETQTQAQTSAPRLKTNLDTNFLKLVAILCMVVDHVGTVFFPDTRPSGGWDGWPSHLLLLPDGGPHVHPRH